MLSSVLPPEYTNRNGRTIVHLYNTTNRMFTGDKFRCKIYIPYFFNS